MPEKENTATNGNAPATIVTTANTPTAAQHQPASATQPPSTVQPLNNTRKRTPDEYTKNFDLNEISPLHTSSASSNGSGTSTTKGIISTGTDKSDLNARNGALLPPVVLQMRAVDAAGGDAATTTVDTTFLPGSKRNKFKGRYDELMGRLDLSERARTPFVLLVALCAVLLIVLVVLVALWPRIPAYLRTPVCVERECLEASAQMLLWANVTTESVCQQPYEWACGRFDEDYADNPLNGIYGGEWTAASSAEYEELLQIHSFVAQLPTPALSSAQLTLKRLHADCMKSDMVDKKTADFALSQAIRSLSEWVYSRDWVHNAWDMQSAVSIAHAKFGLSPFFSVSVQNRNSAPFGNIIALSEGRLGLPHQMFYNLRHDHRIIEAYKMLLRDFAINYGTVAEVAKKFADEMFYFEKRITNTLPKERTPAIMTLGEVQKLAPMLPISVTIARIFSNTNVDENTPIWVEDANMLREMSIIVSTSDVNPLNSFLVWSLARHYMPFMSAEYRDALRNFNSVLYGHKSQPPAWLQCAKLLHDWVPFAVDALRFNPELVVTPQTSASLFDRATADGGGTDQHQYSEPLVRDRIDYDRELVRLLFAHLRHQMQRAVDDNVAIETDVTAYINDQLAKMQLHIGLPEEAVASTAYVNAFFAQFMFHKLNFIEKLESRWTFAMRTRELQMVAKNTTDKIVSVLYPSTGTDRSRTLVQYSIDLHAIVVSEQAVHKPYFHHKYPLAINFARLGAQISQSLLVAVNALGTEFEQRKHRNATGSTFTLGNYACLTNQLHPDPQQQPVPDAARQHYLNDLTAATFTSKAFAEFQRMLAANRPVPDAGLSDLMTYDRMGLREAQRQAGLQRLDDGQLFALATLQTHCGRGVSESYRRFKPFVEGRVAQRDLFDSTWNQVPLLSRFLQCPASSTKCESVL